MTIGRHQFDTQSGTAGPGGAPRCNAVAIVTGGAGGIGSAACRALASQGFAVVIVFNSSQAAAEALEGEITAEGGVALALRGDVSHGPDVAMIIDTVIARFGRIDALVNNAGISSHHPFGSMTEADVDRAFAVNVKSIVLMTQACAVHMCSGSAIVNLGSNLAHDPLPGLTVYGATKAAVAALTKGLARELGERGIRVNAVAPGATRTAMTAWIDAPTMAGIASSTPLGRVGDPADIAGTITFLVSSQSGWTTGQTITVDGGLT